VRESQLDLSGRLLQYSEQSMYFQKQTAHVFFGLVEEAYMGWRYSELGVGLDLSRSAI
jgi:hypothetical protein